ncbi:MAG: ribonuclease P protein component [Alphaproteobacteria bacterium]
MVCPVATLKRRAEFLRIAQGCRKWAVPGLVLQALPTNFGKGEASRSAEGRIRVGFTVSRKVGTAVERNRAKRRLRAVANRVMPQRAKQGYDYVLIGRRGTLTRPFNDLVTDLETALKRVEAYTTQGEGESGGK